ncbi:recombinase family protein [Zavarzinella formosa]|uniref:recombinase family protein n=1 Tax=Zavarzinella formosa TaxID=360055 RepID=UPI000380A628|nr:recombinase family protein [Zavarzinella formosa]
MIDRKTPVTPRNGHTLVVGVVARISGRPNQKEVSLDDQEDHARDIVDDMHEGPAEYRVVATINKGERLNRPELEKIERMLRSGELDFLIAEDLGRIVRGVEAVRLCGVAVDHGVRVIAPHDGIDTARDTWEQDAIEACKEHVGHNAHTSRRLKFKLMNRFKKSGATAARPIFGYAVPPGARTYDEWLKDPSANRVLREWLERLLGDPNCSAVADWLNGHNVPPGPGAKNQKWDGRMVRRVTANPILKGLPCRGRMRTVKHNGTGQWLSRKNPDGPVFRECPHLAHWTSEEFDRVNARLSAANEGCGRKAANGSDSRAGIPKKRTAWPGRHVMCGICNRPYYWGGHGRNSHMMCSGARDYKCWNTVTFNGHEAADRIARAVLDHISRLPDFEPVFLDKVRAWAEARNSTCAADLRQADQELTTVRRQLQNVADMVADWGGSRALHEKDKALQKRERELLDRLSRLTRQPVETVTFPTMEEIRRTALDAIKSARTDQAEFGRVMRLVIPCLRVLPVRLCDGGGLTLRAAVTFDLKALIPPEVIRPEPEPSLRSEIIVDLFDPPERAKFREEIIRRRQAGETQKAIGDTLDLTITAVQRAAALDRMMRAQGRTDPYVPVTEPPSDCTKMKRHHHRRYAYTPLPSSEPA